MEPRGLAWAWWWWRGGTFLAWACAAAAAAGRGLENGRSTTTAPPREAGVETTTTPWYTTKTTIVADGTLGIRESALLTASRQSLAFKPWRPSAPGAATDECSERFLPPAKAPRHATALNGIQLPDVCFREAKSPHHIFVIGDWGGVLGERGKTPVPADRRSKHMPTHHRPFVMGADDCAQQNVAEQMRKRSEVHPPDYIINCGDNFYWGGVLIKCGGPADTVEDASGQWEWIFERMYDFPGIAGKQWLGVLGNHDYGGFMFTHGWDQAIGYTWTKGHPSKGRWVTPAQYWKVKVHYPDFALDYYFVDSNAWDAFEPSADQGHNLCSKKHNLNEGATCGIQGPVSVEECPGWFDRLWEAQVAWLDKGLEASTAEWQVVVTHFPPEHGLMDWKRITAQHGVDLLITGHRHQQEVHYLGDGNFLRPTAFLVSGGGGGITSEGLPNATGDDDQYGFMDLSLTKEEIMIEAISHGGLLRSRTCVRPRPPGGGPQPLVGRSLCVIPSTTTRPPPAAPQFNCSEGLDDWQMLWSYAKGRWCCKHGNICMGAFQEHQLSPLSTSAPPTPQPPPPQPQGPLGTGSASGSGTQSAPSSHQTVGAAAAAAAAAPADGAAGEQVTTSTPEAKPEPEPKVSGEPTASREPTASANSKEEDESAFEGVAFDCLAGYYDLEREWSEQKRLWCCAHEKLGCNHLHNCNPDDPGNLRSSWSVEKAHFCCGTFGVCVPSPAPARAAAESWNCNPEVAGNAVATWTSVQVEYCCHTFQLGCEREPVSTSRRDPWPAATASGGEPRFDCKTDLLEWELMWSVAKQEWCCRHAKLGCVQVKDCDEHRVDDPYERWSLSKKEWCCMHWDVRCGAISTVAVEPVSFKQLWAPGVARGDGRRPLAPVLAATAALALAAVAGRPLWARCCARARQGARVSIATEDFEEELLNLE